MIYKGTVRVDLHGKNKYQAKIALDSALRKAGSGIYRVLVIHGYHSGTELRDMVREEYANHPKVRRVEPSDDPGQTILVLRDLY